jgi:hypothetical protein
MFDLAAIRQALRDDKMGYLAGVIAGPILYLGFQIALML